MTRLFVLTAALGLSASAAFAECSYHNKVNASVDVDRTMTTASVPADEAPKDVVLLKQQRTQVQQQTTE
ncbi:hypothetical protein [Ensifer soli]|uniref:hypothetical protein n=1 Tax=Ciceribacter sp. sgz301302 TaxID=3342379 RepID=UPI0035B77A4D